VADDGRLRRFARVDDVDSVTYDSNGGMG
jgi:hypothetical protein